MGERITLTHGCSLSNLPLFVAEEARLFAEEGLEVEAPVFSAMSATAEALSSGISELGTVAFTEPLIDSALENPPIIVGGSGLMGIALLAQSGIADIPGLAGRKIGTFRRDPLETLLHDALAAAGLGFGDAEVVYLDDFAEALEGFRGGDLDAITLAEPHATRLRDLGAVDLSDGTELWGSSFPDTVMVASRRFLTDKPDLVAAALRAMRRAEAMILADPVGILSLAAKQFPGYEAGELERGSARQPPCIDIRPYVETIFGRWPSLQSLGLVPGDRGPPTDVVSLDILSDVLGRQERDDSVAAVR